MATLPDRTQPDEPSPTESHVAWVECYGAPFQGVCTCGWASRHTSVEANARRYLMGHMRERGERTDYGT